MRLITFKQNQLKVLKMLDFILAVRKKSKPYFFYKNNLEWNAVNSSLLMIPNHDSQLILFPSRSISNFR